MKRIWWSSVILFLCLMYFVTGSAGGFQHTIGRAGFQHNVARSWTSSWTSGSEGVASLNIPTRRMGSHIRLRPTDTMPEAVTLYEQARANLAMR
jgi:hypothetical protein